MEEKVTFSNLQPDASDPAMAKSRAAVIARMEEIRQQYNQLAQYLAAQSQQTHHIQDVASQDQNDAEEATMDALKREVKNLSNQLHILTAEKATLERTLEEHKNDSTKSIAKMNQELKGWKDDTDVLKDILKRLNEQLNRYHIKHGPLRGEEETRRITKDISRQSIYKLKALLIAYDELLFERDSTIKSSTEKLEKMMLRVNDVVCENEKLHNRLEKLQSEVPLGSEEAEMVAADARLLLEEREILLQEIQVLRQQRQQEVADSKQEVMRLQDKLEEYEVKNHTLSSDLDTWKVESAQLEKQCRALRAELRGTVSKQEHQFAVDECQRLFEELRAAYDQRSVNLKGKMQAAKHEKKHLAEKLTDTSTHVHSLSVQVSGLKGSLRKTECRVQRRERSLKAMHTAVRLAQSRLKSLTAVCSELLEDREKLLDALVAQRKETEELSREVTLRSATVGVLSQKLKEERLTWSGRFAESEGALKAAKSAWKRSNREVSHLRSLIASKDDTIASLVAEYKLLGLDYGDAKYHNLRQHLPKHHKVPGGAG
ncbi:centrosomal protein of 89 kDa isoform X2 [Procambarus clarkii]|uniref:centrosomal protein of 89 kDa isoform X2 n=1 Tax=Procambarus clarkii TaxID=6728 RepID=UPI001E676075|nr:centrosomal protein of 89 kDa-like isoform X1 [Procambarus clarkii]XP_045595151.1 centrosomal protein of 89 kDa-like isoform X1 [Procambarus clarkii]XP_045595152.1 centrosomal protein of 89 kDa-like isoform X1 [Procambarus clarkii]XP_045595153.1 centrosomal protein of 89 kDa-like isoform X1 [Procambarus clarkii]XP_045595154.1 centrosomal protein of 89 kDa-like isoform X1 [Procambarus clarkii]XP_045595155.1 centrosomal protein of 89 kDa-like isoform X1 [Procambarus clarkii]XP_045595156.1 ce